ncbi:MAG: FAD-dependent oxidoreductase, partial [Candidatus Sumerlaeota bacterium]|nr:FAD-dependent oxidoreductase [Candidatus Sumerlaeota bacterium]
MDFVEEPARRTPVIANVDVLVAGGGPGGIAAALAAAREGARTLLVERYGYLGGMITGAHVVAVLGCGDGNGPKIQGIPQEIRERFECLGAMTPIRDDDYRVDAEVFKWQAVEMLSEAGAKVLLHSLACAPILENGQVAGAIFENKSGRQAVRARV